MLHSLSVHRFRTMDGQEIGWLIVGALTIAWVLKEFGRRLL